MYSLIFAAVGIISFIAFSFLVHPQQDFVVAQSPPIYDTNKISKTILVSNSSSVTGSSTAETTSISSPTGVMYTTKFECGSHYASKGTLKAVHHDTDVSI